MTLSNNITLCIVCALHCEAKPIIQALSLRKFNDPEYEIYYNPKGSTLCIISGVGKLRMASAIAYCYGRYPLSSAQLINIGIAGSKHFEIGTLVEINKITDHASQRRYYPEIFARGSFCSTEILTHDTETSNYPADGVIDLEASGFYVSANKFLDREQLRLLKVVSDTPNKPARHINANHVKELIESNITSIMTYLKAMKNRSSPTEITSSIDIASVTDLCHFSTYEQHQLKSLIRRWHVNFPEKNLLQAISSYHTAKAILTFMQSTLLNKEYRWDE